MTEEHKAKIKESKKRAKEERLAQGLPARKPRGSNVVKHTPKHKNDKPVLIYDGTEENVFDFWKRIRNTFRPLHLYTQGKDVEKAIYDVKYYQNVPWIIERLANYVTLELVSDVKKVKKEKKERKKGNHTITPEHKAKMLAGRKIKKEICN